MIKIDVIGNPETENPVKGEHLSIPEVVEPELSITVACADKTTRDTNNAATAFDNAILTTDDVTPIEPDIEISEDV